VLNVLDALRMAMGIRGPGAQLGLVHHSDQGSQCTSVDYADALSERGLLASVGTIGDAYDNVPAESFVDSFKTELIADRVWRSRAHLELPTVEYIGWFNTARLRSALGYHTPAEHEAACSTAKAQALQAQGRPNASQLPTLAGGLSDR
jgi:putative transposase